MNPLKSISQSRLELLQFPLSTDSLLAIRTAGADFRYLLRSKRGENIRQIKELKLVVWVPDELQEICCCSLKRLNSPRIVCEKANKTE
jgi:ABC-type Zn2+ transport system substrate-binding protein/surface adhesin